MNKLMVFVLTMLGFTGVATAEILTGTEMDNWLFDNPSLFGLC